MQVGTCLLPCMNCDVDVMWCIPLPNRRPSMKCPPYFLSKNLMTFVAMLEIYGLVTGHFGASWLFWLLHLINTLTYLLTYTAYHIGQIHLCNTGVNFAWWYDEMYQDISGRHRMIFQRALDIMLLCTSQQVHVGLTHITNLRHALDIMLLCTSQQVHIGLTHITNLRFHIDCPRLK